MKKLVAVLATATIAFWTPSIVPVKAVPIVGCGIVPVNLEFQTIDTAFAGRRRFLARSAIRRRHGQR